MRTMLFMGIFMLCYLPLLLYLAFVPYLTRTSRVFGVGIPEVVYAHADVLELRRKYTNAILGYGLPLGMACCIIAYYTYEFWGAGVLLASILIQSGMGYSLYTQFHNKMKSLKEKKQWKNENPEMVLMPVSDAPQVKRVSAWWFLIPLGMIAVHVGTVYVLYPKIPLEIPVSFYGSSVLWTPKSEDLLWLGTAFQIFSALIALFFYISIGRGKQPVDPVYMTESMDRNRLLRLRWSGISVFAALMMVLMLGLLQFSFFFFADIFFMSFIPVIFIGFLLTALLLFTIIPGKHKLAT